MTKFSSTYRPIRLKKSDRKEKKLFSKKEKKMCSLWSIPFQTHLDQVMVEEIVDDVFVFEVLQHTIEVNLRDTNSVEIQPYNADLRATI